MIVFITVILLVIYYLTPNNYWILELDQEKNEIKKIKEINLVVEPYSTTKLDPDEISKKIIEFNQDTHIIVKNLMKSQSIICTQNNLIQARFNSDIYIVNDSDNKLELIISIYAK